MTAQLTARLLDAQIDYDPDVSSLDDLRALLAEARYEIDRLTLAAAVARRRPWRLVSDRELGSLG